MRCASELDRVSERNGELLIEEMRDETETRILASPVESRLESVARVKRIWYNESEAVGFEEERSGTGANDERGGENIFLSSRSLSFEFAFSGTR